jgi:hypothetical protein
LKKKTRSPRQASGELGVSSIYVVALELDVDKVGQVTRREVSDVALVGLGES